MEDLVSKVVEFNKKMGAYMQYQPANIPHEILVLRRKQLREELDEYLDAVQEGDIEHIAKELGDILYMAIASVCDHGLQNHLGGILEEVHRSNMSKLDDEGKPVKNEDGKIVKGKNFSPADLSFVKTRRF